MTEMLSLPEIEALARDCLCRAGVSADRATAVAREVTAAEAAAERQHGLELLLRDIKALRYGQIVADAPVLRHSPRPGILHIDAHHGFAAATLMDAMDDLCEMVALSGVAVLRLDRASPVGAMLRPVSYLVAHGFAALGCGAEGHGRLAHPVHGVSSTLSDTTAPPLVRRWLTDTTRFADDPFAGPANGSAWLIAADPQNIGDGSCPAPLFERPLPQLDPVPVPVDLLAQIIAA